MCNQKMNSYLKETGDLCKIDNDLETSEPPYFASFSHNI